MCAPHLRGRRDRELSARRWWTQALKCSIIDRMASVLQLKKPLFKRHQTIDVKGFAVRSFDAEADIQHWLELRNQAFAKQRLGVRQWDHEDFVREFFQHWWWQPDRMWLAEIDQGSSVVDLGNPGKGSNPRQLIGSVTLAMRGEQDSAKPVVHWLMVHPRWRRRGVARLLMAHLEVAAWDVGHRELWLETHVAWEAAAKFYEALGFRPM